MPEARGHGRVNPPGLPPSTVPFVARAVIPGRGDGAPSSPSLLKLLFPPFRLDDPLLDLALRGLGGIPSQPLRALAEALFVRAFVHEAPRP